MVGEINFCSATSNLHKPYHLSILLFFDKYHFISELFWSLNHGTVKNWFELETIITELMVLRKPNPSVPRRPRAGCLPCAARAFGARAGPADGVGSLLATGWWSLRGLGKRTNRAWPRRIRTPPQEDEVQQHAEYFISTRPARCRHAHRGSFPGPAAISSQVETTPQWALVGRRPVIPGAPAIDLFVYDAQSRCPHLQPYVFSLNFIPLGW